MKKITDLQVKREEKLETQKSILERIVKDNREKNATEELILRDLKQDVYEMEKTIASLQLEDDNNKRNGGTNHPNPANSDYVNTFREKFDSVVKNRRSESFTLPIQLREDPITTTTNTDIINKWVAPIIDERFPYETLLLDLGIKRYDRNINANIVVPRLSESMATFVQETESAVSADISTNSVTMYATRVSLTQGITLETTAQTTDYYSNILLNLVDGLYKAVAFQFFSRVKNQVLLSSTSGTVTLKTLANMEASLGYVNLVNPKYVCSPQVKATFKSTAGLPYSQFPICVKNIVNEYPLISTPAVLGVGNEDLHYGDFVFFGDWNKGTAIAQWNGIDIIVDPYTDAKKGIVNLTAIGMFDCAVVNNNYIVGITDPSAFI